MRIIACIVFFSSISAFTLRAQDIIIQKNGEKIEARIVHEDSVKVDFTFVRNDRRITSYLNRTEIDSIVYKRDKIAANGFLPGNERGAIGFGFGREYGGLGLNMTAYIGPHVGLFAGAGYAFVNVAFSGGIKVRLIKRESTHSVVPFLMGMYGYTTAIHVTNAPDYNKLFYNPTFGFGLDIYTRPRKGSFTLCLQLPVISDEVERYAKRFQTNVYKVGFSIGYRIPD